MISVRPVASDELAWLTALDPDAPEFEAQLRAIWDDGAGRPDWTLVAEDEGRPLARGALWIEPLGCGLSTVEGRIAGLWLDWRAPAHGEAAAALLDAIAELARPVTPFIERRLNPEVHARVADWRSVLEAARFGVFHEKEGFVWTDAGQPLTEPARVRFRPLSEVGRDAFATAMASGIRGTLDRNDRFYVDACGVDGWGREMVGFLEPGDEGSWLLAYEPDGTLAGYVAVGSFEPGVATIVHVGVVPERRGRGYSDDLLAAANLAARRRGDRSILSDVDTENEPMLAAMQRNGHHRGVRPWHVWAYRRDLRRE